MVSGIVRLILGVIIFFILELLFKKAAVKNNKKNNSIFFFISLIITVLLLMFPIENAFATFSTPQSAFSYSQTGKVQIVVNGKNSSMVVADENGTNKIAVFPKSDDLSGWKIGNGNNIKFVAELYEKDIFAQIYNYSSTDDYYIIVNTYDAKICEISDNHNSDFRLFGTDDKNKYCQYIAYIEDFSEDYVLTVDGKSVKVNT